MTDSAFPVIFAQRPSVTADFYERLGFVRHVQLPPEGEPRSCDKPGTFPSPGFTRSARVIRLASARFVASVQPSHRRLPG
jgi:hypothetical protein